MDARLRPVHREAQVNRTNPTAVEARAADGFTAHPHSQVAYYARLDSRPVQTSELPIRYATNPVLAG
jgi:hypothetical protein